MADHLKNKKQIEENESVQGQTMEDHLKRKEENEVNEATSENKTPREENEKEDGAAEKKRPREENEATAEKTQPDIAANGISASPTTSVHLHNEVQPQQKQEVRGYSSSINLFHVLRDRQLGEYDIKKLPSILPNILGDYHLQAFHTGMNYVDTLLVMADDTICVIHYINYDMACIVPFRRQVDPFQISVFTDDDNRPIMNVLPWFDNIYYNPHNNSLIMMSTDIATRQQRFISIDMPSIKAGLTTSYKQLFQDESILIYDSDVDIRNCRCMICNRLEKVFKFYELREYSQLFTIPVPEPSSSLQYQIQAAVNNNRRPEVPGFTFGSPENMDMLIHQRIFEESILFRIYCKRNGKLRKEFFLPLEVDVVQQARRPLAVPVIKFVLLCGSDRMVVQQAYRTLDVVDISCENPVYIKRTNIHATCQPYYLTKSSKFICCDSTISKVRVCNLEGEILATLHDHPVFWSNGFNKGFHITKSEDIIISVCQTGQDLCSINVSSILTGQCLAKISPHTANCSRIRQEALAFRIEGFAYDDRTHEIFTTNNRGICCVWSNRFCNDVGNIDNYPLSELSHSTDDEHSDEPSDDEPSGGEEFVIS